MLIVLARHKRSDTEYYSHLYGVATASVKPVLESMKWHKTQGFHPASLVARSTKEGKKTSILKEKPKVTYSVALVLAFLSAENESRKLEDLPLVDFGRLPERLLPSVRIELAGANALYDCYSGIVDSLIFIH